MLRRGALAALGGATLLSAGCNVVAPLIYVIEGPPTREPQFVLEERKTVVFVDDRDGVIPLRSRQMRRQLGRTITEVLNTREDLLPGFMIDSGDAIALAEARDRDGVLMSLGAIGEEIGAEVLISVQLRQFTLRGGGQLTPTAVAGVRILDITNRTALFPPLDSPEPMVNVVAELELGAGLGETSESERVALFFALAQELGDKVAKLFYEHEIKEVGERLDSNQ